MIAISAVRAICAPKVGPIEFDEKSARSTPKSSSSASRTSRTSPGSSVGVAIWKTLRAEVGLVDLLDLRVLEAERRERVAHLVDVGAGARPAS